MNKKIYLYKTANGKIAYIEANSLEEAKHILFDKYAGRPDQQQIYNERVKTLIDQLESEELYFTFGSDGTIIDLTEPVRLNQNALHIDFQNAQPLIWNIFQGSLTKIYSYTYINKKGERVFLDDVWNNENLAKQKVAALGCDPATIKFKKGIIGDPRFNTDEGRIKYSRSILKFYNEIYGPKLYENYKFTFTPKPIDEVAISAVQIFNRIADTSIKVDGWLGSQTSRLKYPLPTYLLVSPQYDAWVNFFKSKIGIDYYNWGYTYPPLPPNKPAGTSEKDWYYFGKHPNGSTTNNMTIAPQTGMNVLLSPQGPRGNNPRDKPPGYYGKGYGGPPNFFETEYLNWKSTVPGFTGQENYVPIIWGTTKFVIKLKSLLLSPLYTLGGNSQGGNYNNSTYGYGEYELYDEDKHGNNLYLYNSVNSFYNDSHPSIPGQTIGDIWFGRSSSTDVTIDLKNEVETYKSILKKKGLITTITSKVNASGFINVR